MEKEDHQVSRERRAKEERKVGILELLINDYIRNSRERWTRRERW